MRARPQEKGNATPHKTLLTENGQLKSAWYLEQGLVESENLFCTDEIGGFAPNSKLDQAVSRLALTAFFFSITSAGLLRDSCPTPLLAASMRSLNSAAE